MKIVGKTGIAARFFFIAVFINFISSHTALAEDDKFRLLPGSLVRDVRVDFKQDGRLLDVVLSAPSGKWVVTQLSVKVEFQRPENTWMKPAVPQKAETESSDPFGWTQQTGPFYGIPETETHKIVAEVQPDKSRSTHLELKTERAVTSVTILEARGREQTMLDRVKTLVR